MSGSHTEPNGAAGAACTSRTTEAEPTTSPSIPSANTTLRASGAKVLSCTASSTSATVKLGRQAQEVGAHQATGRLGVVAEQGPDLVLLGLGQQVEDREPTLLVDVADQVGGVVGGHRRQQPGGLGVRSGSDELGLVLGVQLLEHVGLELDVLRRPPR